METKHVLTFNIKLNDGADKHPVRLTVNTSGLTPEDVMAYALRSIKIDFSRQARYNYSSGGAMENEGAKGFGGFVTQKDLTYLVPKPGVRVITADPKAVAKDIAVSYADKYPGITSNDLVALIREEITEAELARKYLANK